MKKIRYFIISIIGGIISGLTGIGGGTVMVPLFTSFTKMQQHRAHANSLVIVIFGATAALILYIIPGDIDKTSFIVISKSGSTAETLGQFSSIIEIFESQNKIEKLSQSCIIITENIDSPLRRIANKLSCISSGSIPRVTIPFSPKSPSLNFFFEVSSKTSVFVFFL